MTKVLHLNSADPEPAAIREGASVIRRGGLVAFPTETVYGLGADVLDAAAVQRVFTAKGRPATNPLIVHVATVDEAKRLAAGWPNDADRLANKFWPGPLTLVLEKSNRVPGIVTAGGNTVAIRMPAHPVAIALVRESGRPLAAPSANASNTVSPTSAEHVTKTLAGRIDLVLDGGPCPGGVESTVFDLTTQPPRILRPGPVTAEQLKAIVGDLSVERVALDADEILPSPGTSERHYAPHATVEAYGSLERLERRFQQLLQNEIRTGVLLRASRTYLFKSLAPVEPPRNAVLSSISDNPAEYAMRLYAALHELDDLNVEYILIDVPPSADEWDAVRDRLRRAASVWEES